MSLLYAMRYGTAMDKELSWHLLTLSVFYIIAGINHFRRPKTYLSIMPPWLPWPKALNYLAGATESLLGLAVVWAPTRRCAAWGLVILLLSLMPVHLHMLCRGGNAYKLPTWVLIARLPLQGLLIAWAWLYTQ
jgi:uncharacterized membrane protein